MKQGIIFDLDGTLWDSSKAVVDSWNEKIKEFPDIDYEMTYKQMQGYMGMTMEEIAFAFFHTVSKKRALELLKICTDYENEYIVAHGGVLYEGVKETLSKLHEDYFLAIVSNCQEGYIEAFLQHHKLEQYFDDTENYGRTLKPKSDNICLLVKRNHLDKAVYVGDTMGDYQATIKAGFPFIHAAYGFGTVTESTPEIHDIRELPDCVVHYI